MIVSIFSAILWLVFTVLGGFHFYWLFGGKWGVEKVIPTKDDGSDNMTIPKFATLLVAIVLTTFGIIYLNTSGIITLPFPNWIIDYILWFIPSIFLLRAIGEFKYVGFFKQIKHTTFAKADSSLFSPLCLIIAALGFLIQI